MVLPFFQVRYQPLYHICVLDINFVCSVLLEGLIIRSTMINRQRKVSLTWTAMTAVLHVY